MRRPSRVRKHATVIAHARQRARRGPVVRLSGRRERTGHVARPRKNTIMQQIDSMEALYAAGIAELKSAEQQGMQAYDSFMVPAVKSPELKQALE